MAATLEELRRTFRELEEKRRLERSGEKERVERQRRITALLSDAWAALKDRRLADAERALELVRDIDPAVPELSDLLERVQQAQAAARRNEELERTLGELDQQLSQGDLARAGDLLQSAASLAATDSRVHSARQRFDQATAARAAKEAAEARQREGEQRIEAAAAHLAAGDLAGASADLTRAAELAPQHPRAAELSVQLQAALARRAAAEAAERLRRQVKELIGSASQRLHAAGDTTDGLVVALREVNRALELDPGERRRTRSQNRD